MGLRVLALTVFVSNSGPVHVCEKVGFVQTGRIPKNFSSDGKYIDGIIMSKLLE